jgi:hypothetical protein
MSSLSELRREGLRIFLRILKLHKTLPDEMKELGNSYVRQEFRLHHFPESELFSVTHYVTFLNSWKDYLEEMQKTEVRLYGRDLTSEEISKMNKQQKTTINNAKPSKI